MKLTINLMDGTTETFSIRRRGMLAVHPAAQKCAGWRVTHIPTRLALPLICCSENHAMALALKLSTQDWDFGMLPMPPALQKIARTAVLGLQKRCRACLLELAHGE